MSETLDLLIRHARLRRRPGALYDIAVQGGCIELIEESPGVSAAVVVDAAGGLVTEPFVNPHLHLDKVYTLQRLDEESSLRAYHGEGMGNAMHAIKAASRVKESYSQNWIVENAREALRAAAVHGNTYIRAFADVDSKARLEGVKALLQVKEEFRGVVELQVVAFPQDGVLPSPARRISCGRRWRWARTWSEASPGSSTRMPRLENTCGRCSTSPWPATGPSPCSWTTPAMPACARWR